MFHYRATRYKKNVICLYIIFFDITIISLNCIILHIWQLPPPPSPQINASPVNSYWITTFCNISRTIHWKVMVHSAWLWSFSLSCVQSVLFAFFFSPGSGRFTNFNWIRSNIIIFNKSKLIIKINIYKLASKQSLQDLCPKMCTYLNCILNFTERLPVQQYRQT